MRVKTGSVRRKRHQKVLRRTKGFRQTKSKLWRAAKQADLHAGQYAFIGRKLRKRDFRRIWITRINAALTEQEISYSQFIKALKDTKINLNRKVLADLAVSDPSTFEAVVKKVKA